MASRAPCQRREASTAAGADFPPSSIRQHSRFSPSASWPPGGGAESQAVQQRRTGDLVDEGDDHVVEIASGGRGIADGVADPHRHPRLELLPASLRGRREGCEGERVVGDVAHLGEDDGDAVEGGGFRPGTRQPVRRHRSGQVQHQGRDRSIDLDPPQPFHQQPRPLQRGGFVPGIPAGAPLSEDVEHGGGHRAFVGEPHEGRDRGDNLGGERGHRQHREEQERPAGHERLELVAPAGVVEIAEGLRIPTGERDP
jgi:hypothetical protein